MPAPFGLLDTTLASFMMGNCKVFRPTAVTATPLQVLGYLDNAKLSIKGTKVDLETKIPKYLLRQWQIGMGAEISGDLSEMMHEVNLDMFTGAAHSDVSAFAGAVLVSGYTAGGQTLIVTGDHVSDFPAPGMAHISESGVGAEDFTVAKAELDTTNTKLTLPLGDTLIHSYTTAATVSRKAYTSNGFGRIEQVPSGAGAVLFTQFQPEAGAAFKALLITAWKMVLPRDLDLTLIGEKPLTTPFTIQLHADPTKANGQQLGLIDIYALTA